MRHNFLKFIWNCLDKKKCIHIPVPEKTFYYTYCILCFFMHNIHLLQLDVVFHSNLKNVVVPAV